MSDEIEESVDQLPLDGAGQRLLRARKDAGKSIDQIAAETRIPIRHLQVIEDGNFAALPARTYAVGFSRTYAKAVGLDEIEIADQVRSELAANNDYENERPARFEPGDPARIPSRGLAWFSAFAVLLLVAGAFAFFRGYFIPGSGPGSIVEPTEVSEETVTGGDGADIVTSSSKPTGEVVFTSLADGVWVKFYDQDGERLMEREMAKGEKYSVPSDSQGPQIWTGQPEALMVSIGGTSIGNLSDESEILRDLPVTADALIARAEESETAADGEAGEVADETN
ncbi:hypothetical protein GCM10023115_55290 [Pontixanthobacter gangjinensis]|uniref:DUF4115 domain-containing protein n=1 Tax=Pontixanthobacter gangjinensis TaxID=1028742 RepID=A0A6I4SRR6_9SPHN|nr:helix-turn-helix domain-containing protein [Pontixanthobacter gangjinensis]MXO57810.1 DUF4115 domain-containing protein [Pontixanthobacter gangjinensis]